MLAIDKLESLPIPPDDNGLKAIGFAAVTIDILQKARDFFLSPTIAALIRWNIKYTLHIAN